MQKDRLSIFSMFKILSQKCRLLALKPTLIDLLKLLRIRFSICITWMPLIRRIKRLGNTVEEIVDGVEALRASWANPQNTLTF